MKHILYIFTFLLFTSCSARKAVVADVVCDEDAFKLQQTLQQEKVAFMNTDSAANIVRDLGWADRLLTDAKIQGYNVPSVFKLVDGTTDVFTVQSPCVEIDAEEYLSVVVFAEHEQLDSALIYTKIKGVDAIYMQLMDDYAGYMREAKFSCLCVVKDKKKYIANATVFVPRKKFIIDKTAIDKNINKLVMGLDDKPDKTQTENAETPSK